MKNIMLCAVLFITAHSAFSQSEIEPPIADQFDNVTLDWVDKSGELKTYEGISNYCKKPQYRKSVNQILNIVHTYDSLILAELEDTSDYLNWDKKEEKKTLSDIENMEADYGMKEFDKHMRKVCVSRREIETNKEDLKNGLGTESYDAQIMVLEQSQVRYFNRIDKLILKIDEHLHVLNIDR
ncbi:MAG: hypothetical protein WBA74_07550 [Cyclobacteriaceae bacterium]